MLQDNSPRLPDIQLSLRDTPALSAQVSPAHTKSIAASLTGTFVLRIASAIAGNMIQFYFSYIDRNLYPLSDTMRGFALALFFLPELVGAPVLGAWSDRIGRKFFMLLGVLSGALGVLITALTTNFGLLAITRFLGGLSTASHLPATLGYLSATTAHSEPLRARVMGIFQIVTVAGTVVGIFFGGRIWDALASQGFMLDAFVYFASFLVFLFGIRELRAVSRLDSAPPNWIAHYRSLFASRAILRFAPAWIAISMVLGIWMNHTISQLVSSRNHFSGQLLHGLLANHNQAGNVVSTYATGLVALFGIGVAFWSFMLGKMRRSSVMILASGALLILCVNLFLLNHARDFSAPLIPLHIVVTMISIFCASGLMPGALTYLADVTEESTNDRGAIMGLYTIFFGIGQFLGTMLGGPFADWGAIDGILLVTILLGLVSAIELIRLHRHESKVAQFSS